MKHIRRSIDCAVILTLGLFSLGGLASISFSQAISEAEQLQREIDYWSAISKTGKVLLIPMNSQMSREEVLDFINGRTNPNFRGRYLVDPRYPNDTYVPMDKDEFGKKVKDMPMDQFHWPDSNLFPWLNTKEAQRKNRYLWHSNRMKYYLIGDWIPMNRFRLAKLQPPPPNLTPEQKIKELESLTDMVIKRLGWCLVEAKVPGPRNEMKDLYGKWRKEHLSNLIRQVVTKPPPARNAYLDYLDCLDTVYQKYIRTGDSIIDDRQQCYEKEIKPWL